MTIADVRAKTKRDYANQAVFDADLYSDALAVFMRLDASSYAEHSTPMLNPPDLEDRLRVAAGVRALGNSEMLNYMVPSGVVTARLYFLVAFLEGVVMPHLQVLIELCSQDGHVGKLDRKGKTQLERERSKFSSECRFVATTGAPSLSQGPRLLAEITWLSDDKIPQLRNAVAHFSFRLEEKVVAPSSIPSFQALGSFGAVGLKMATSVAKLLGVPGFDAARVPDYERCFIQYEENYTKPLKPDSRKRPYPELRTIVQRVEQLGFAMMIALLDVGKIHRSAGHLMLGGCNSCHLGTRAGVPGSTVECPVCDHKWTFQ